jgi:hypothetical protein
MRNYKTTISGIIAAAGSYLSSSQTGWLQALGYVLQAVGVLMLGAAAKDHDVR